MNCYIFVSITKYVSCFFFFVTPALGTRLEAANQELKALNGMNAY